MASERQIATNRENARKSTGPRSAAGKKRASRNAYSHGLSFGITSVASAKQIDKLARKIAGKLSSGIALQYAYDAAHAELDLARVRKVRTALIERVLALGAVELPAPGGSGKADLRHLKLVLAGKAILEEPVDPLATMPSVEPERSAEAVRRALPDLVKLVRYERRAVARRNRAIKLIILSRNQKY